MRVNPDYFAWSLEAQERYRVSMPEQDAFRLRQTLLKTLFDLHAQTEEDLEKITDQFSNEEHLVFNRAWLPAAGVGEDSFFLNEYLDEGKTLLDFGTLYEYDYDDHNFQEQARKDEMPESTWSNPIVARSTTDGHVSLSMAVFTMPRCVWQLGTFITASTNLVRRRYPHSFRTAT